MSRNLVKHWIVSIQVIPEDIVIRKKNEIML